MIFEPHRAWEGGLVCGYRRCLLFMPALPKRPIALGHLLSPEDNAWRSKRVVSARVGYTGVKHVEEHAALALVILLPESTSDVDIASRALPFGPTVGPPVAMVHATFQATGTSARRTTSMNGVCRRAVVACWNWHDTHGIKPPTHRKG